MTENSTDTPETPATGAAPVAGAPAGTPVASLKPAATVDTAAEVTQAITVALDAFGSNPSHVKAGAVAGVIVAGVQKLIGQ